MQSGIISTSDTTVLKQLVTSLLRDKPSDPIPYIYNYLSQIKSGTEVPLGISNKTIAEVKNMRKKVEHLKSMLGNQNPAVHTESSDEDSGEEMVVPVKRPVKQRAGISAEVFGANNVKEAFVPKVVPKNEETKAALSKRLLQAFMFSALDTKELTIVIDAIEEVRLSAGDKCIVEGDQGDCMYVLEQGSLDCTKVFPGNSEPTHLKTYAPGEGFGELALLYNAPRAATITAKDDSVVWKLDRDTFNNIVKDAAQKKRDRYDDMLKSV